MRAMIRLPLLTVFVAHIKFVQTSNNVLLNNQINKSEKSEKKNKIIKSRSQKMQHFSLSIILQLAFRVDFLFVAQQFTSRWNGKF